MKHFALLFAIHTLAFGALPLPAAPGGFPFQHHFLDRQLPGASWAQTALADLDRDGRLDYITGQTRAPILWYRQETLTRWERHTLGTNSPSDVGGAALDVDGDGWVDFIAGGAWYRNTGKPRAELFERILFDRDLAAVHDLVVADVDEDGRPDVLTMSDRNNLRWYRIPRDPRQPWPRHDIGPGVHAGIGVGDLDGDGDLDVARSNLWFENADGKGTRWVAHENIPFGNPRQPFPLGTHCVALDVDRDGDTDLVMTENEIKAGRIGWLENLDGKGGAWTLHALPQGDAAARGAYHSLVVADFDNDGDPDVFSCEMEGIPGDKPPRWFIWENRDGRGGQFVEHVILDANLGGHLIVAGDVDKDGDLDLVGKLWRPRKDNANAGRNHVDLLENRRVTSSPTHTGFLDSRRFRKSRPRR
ncbi:MAG: VCBS repeat-containing protein [Verrucomicrobia bacterium]|nr:VCBS repeat-containing protein [Verrucomicrobiota bacterium]